MDIIQKCVILSASLADLYGGASIMTNTNRDISIQPFATSSILQHHYQSGGGGSGASNTDFARRNQPQAEGNGNNNFDNLASAETAITTPSQAAATSTTCNNNSSTDNGSCIGNSTKPRLAEGDSRNDNDTTPLHKSSTSTNEAAANQNVGQVS